MQYYVIVTKGRFRKYLYLVRETSEERAVNTLYLSEMLEGSERMVLAYCVGSADPADTREQVLLLGSIE